VGSAGHGHLAENSKNKLVKKLIKRRIHDNIHLGSAEREKSL
jgi:hypothetical protein